MTPGVHRLTMKEYLALPAVSASLLQLAIDECPFAAWYASWLNPAPAAESSNDEQNLGTAVHALILEGRADVVEIIDAKDWRTIAAKDARAAAVAAGKIPLLVHQARKVQLMADAACEYIASLEKTEPAIWQAFQPEGGDSELVLVWQEGDVPCRARPDRISRDRAVIVDLKTCTGPAEPDAWGRRQLVGNGFYVGAAFYRRAVRRLFGLEAHYVFLVQQQEEPFLCSLVGVEPAGLDLGERKVKRGLAAWSTGLATGKWPAYPNRVAYPEFPQWELAREEAVEPRGSTYDYPQMGWKKPPPANALEAFVDQMPE